MIFLGTLATGTGWIAVIIGIVITLIGLLHCILAFCFRDSLAPNKELEEPDDGKPANIASFKQELKQAAVQSAWDNRDSIAQAAYDNREFVAENAGTIAHVAVNAQYN